MGFVLTPEENGCFDVDDDFVAVNTLNAMLDVPPDTVEAVVRLCDFMATPALVDACHHFNPSHEPSLRMGIGKQVFRSGDRDDLANVSFREESYIKVFNEGNTVEFKGWFVHENTHMAMKATVSRSELEKWLVAQPSEEAKVGL